MKPLQESRPRRYDIDALRVLAFSILILYHIGMLYVADWGFHIKSVTQYDWVKFPMLLVNQWRMPLLFLVSGVASSFLIGKFSAIAFVKSRSLRLLIPFITGVILIIPPQAYIQALANGSLFNSFGEMSYGSFLIHYFSFQDWPIGAFDGSEYGFTWNHLWFIPYLFAYTLLLVPVAMLLRISTLQARFERIGSVPLILAPVLIQVIWQLTLNDEKPISHALIDDGYAHAMYCTFFLLGYLISDNAAVWQKIISLRWVSLIGALICYCVLITLWFKFNQHEWQDHLAGVVATFNQWLWLLAVLAWSGKLLNRPRSWLEYANNCVYPWYILHQTITIIAAYFLAKLSLGGPLEFALVLVFTVVGCWAITEYLIRRQKHMKFLFGMK
ncbi:MAG: acyltransferase family protein [Arenicella sp.]|nr:acyltransferase family protein [Arenicella sp.]